MLLLQRFDFLTRDQLNGYFNLGSVRNTNYVLNSLSEYLHCVRNGYQSIYYLSREGRLYVECDKVRKKGSHVEHTVMRNDLWMYFKCPADWKNEVRISNSKGNIIADATFNLNGFECIVEVDNLQSMKENKEKIKKYKELMQSIVMKLGYYPTLIWLTTTELRRRQIEEECQGLKVKALTINDIN
ncbi:TPA: replication-relaxation family protein [Salmonella enterica subsp. enterica serovar Typhi str. AG3]|nr:replication-relaxation family protein [Salmonella enterica subsp. enterica serovar Typhi str. AG3]